MEREIITSYRNNVFAVQSLREQMHWNQRHGLPLLDLPERLTELLRLLIRFDEIVQRIQGIQARTIIRCRFALGWSIPDTAAFMNLSCKTVNCLTAEAFRQMD